MSLGTLFSLSSRIDALAARMDEREPGAYGIDASTLVLSDLENETANAYDVMRWQVATGEPGHTSILVDDRGKIALIKDYGALEHGGIMYVAPDEIVRLIAPLVPG